MLLRTKEHVLRHPGRMLGIVVLVGLPALHHEVAMIALRSRDAEGALRWRHSALREDPTSVPVHRFLADYYQNIGNRERAASHRQFVPSESMVSSRLGS
jgi:hypothetical protein